jgi:hypothetical protein
LRCLKVLQDPAAADAACSAGDDDCAFWSHVE